MTGPSPNADYERVIAKLKHARADARKATKLLQGLPPLDEEQRALLRRVLDSLPPIGSPGTP